MRDRLKRLGGATLRGLRNVVAFALLAVGFVFGRLGRLAQAAAELVAPTD